MNADQAADEAGLLAGQIKGQLAGRNIGVIGATVAELAATFLAGHHPGLRAETRTGWIALVDELVPVIVAEMIKDGRVPKDWNGTLS